MEQLSMFIVILAALVIPIAMAHFKVGSVPTAVAEIVTGIVLGKSGFNLVHETSSLTLLSSLGVVILMFLSGMEIDFSLFKKTPGHKRDPQSPVVIAGVAFGGVIVTAALLGFILKALGLFPDLFLATILFSTVALGVVIATLKEKDILRRPMGQTILLTAVLGEVIPMLALTIYASIYGHHVGRLWLIILLFLAAIFLLHQFRQPFVWFNQISKATTQLDVRLAFFLIFALVSVAETVGAENILGAFLAGMVMKLLQPSEATQEKLTSIGYGFFIPIFFIMTGDRLNLRELFANRAALALIPVLVLCFIMAKLPAFLSFRRRFSNRNSFAASFLTATTITLVLPSLQVARNLHVITNNQSSAFVLAAVIVCILGPIIFNSTYKLEREDLIKQRVVFAGTNEYSVPIVQQLSKNWYETRMVTDSAANYKTYNSEVNHLQYFEQLDADCLAKHGYFDTDVFVAAFASDPKNYTLAKAAKQAGVARVIAGLNRPNADVQHAEELIDLGVEIYNSFVVQTSMLRTMVESPAAYRLMTAQEDGLYEVVITNQRYVGIELHELPYIDKMTVSRIYRKGKLISPHGDTVIELDDHLLFTGAYEDLAAIRRTFDTRAH